MTAIDKKPLDRPLQPPGSLLHLHLSSMIERIRREYNCECVVGEPRVAYRECPTKAVEFNYKHKKQTGGSGQFAHVVGRLVPLVVDGEQEDYEFENTVAGGHIRRYDFPTLRSLADSHNLTVEAWTYWGLPFIPLLVARTVVDIFLRGLEARTG